MTEARRSKKDPNIIDIPTNGPKKAKFSEKEHCAKLYIKGKKKKKERESARASGTGEIRVVRGRKPVQANRRGGSTPGGSPLTNC